MRTMRTLQTLSMVLILALTLGTMIAFAQERTPIQFWFHHGEPEAVDTMNALIAKFEAEYPQYEVDLVVTAGMSKRAMWERLQTTIIGGEPPDLVYTDPQLMAEWGPAWGGFIPMNSLISTDLIEEHDIIPSAKDVLFVRGNWWGLPFRTDSRGLFYNIDHYDEAGLDSRRGPQSFDELDLYAQRLTKYDPTSGDITQLGFYSYTGNNASGLMYFWSFGGDFFDWETLRPTITSYPQNLDAMRWIQSYAERYGARKPLSAHFPNGFQSMVVQSTSSLVAYPNQNPDLNFGVDKFPTVDGVAPVTLAGGVSLGVPMGAENAEAAAQLALFLLRTDNQVAWYEGAKSIPVRISALREIGRFVTDPREQLLIDQLPTAKTTPPSVEPLRLAMEQLQEAMFRMEITPEAVLEEVQRRAEMHYSEIFPN